MDVNLQPGANFTFFFALKHDNSIKNRVAASISDSSDFHSIDVSAGYQHIRNDLFDFGEMG